MNLIIQLFRMMEENEILRVNSSMRVNELISAFRKMFPYLRLELFHNGKEASMVYPLVRLKQLSSRRQSTEFFIRPSMTVQELTDMFWDKMGLQISIARRLANSNVETAFTGQWTLRQQNHIGGQVYNDIDTP